MALLRYPGKSAPLEQVEFAVLMLSENAAGCLSISIEMSKNHCKPKSMREKIMIALIFASNVLAVVGLSAAAEKAVSGNPLPDRPVDGGGSHYVKSPHKSLDLCSFGQMADR